MADAKQSHVFKFFDSLTEAEQANLITQLEAIDVEKVLRTYQLTIQAKDKNGGSLQPLPVVKLWNAPKKQQDEWEKRGLSLIQEGKVAFLLLAGGQGTRLGTSDPKGCYDIGLPSHKSLFQLVAERLHRLRTLSQQSAPASTTVPAIPWYIMTSPMTDAATKAFFKQKRRVQAWRTFGETESKSVRAKDGRTPPQTAQRTHRRSAAIAWRSRRAWL